MVFDTLPALPAKAVDPVVPRVMLVLAVFAVIALALLTIPVLALLVVMSLACCDVIPVLALFVATAQIIQLPFCILYDLDSIGSLLLQGAFRCQVCLDSR